MRNALDFTPYRRSLIGFDSMFDLLENAGRVEQLDPFPPYDIEQHGDDVYRIRVAVAGYTSDAQRLEASVPPAEQKPLQHEGFGSVRTEEQGAPPNSVGFRPPGVQQVPRFPAVTELLHVAVQHAVFVPVGLGPVQPSGATVPELTQHCVH